MGSDKRRGPRTTKSCVRHYLAILFIFGCVPLIYGQTASKCEKVDAPCIKAEKEAADALLAKSTIVDEKTAPASAPAVPAIPPQVPVAPLANSITADPKTPPDKAAADEPAAQQQATGDDSQALAKKLANPVASLISLPFQSNFDFGMGPAEDGFRYTLNVQPVIPITINKDWNVISRTIVPIIGQSDVVGTTSQFGLGDTIQSFFFSPNKAEPFVWGLGPQLLIPTATSEYLGSQKFGLGITGLILKQKGPWTAGALINHMWSVAGKDTRDDVSFTFLQPFISYTTKTAWTFTLNTESTYDWVGRSWSVPIHFQVTKLVRFGKQPVSVGGGTRCWTASGPGGPQWCGFRFIFTPLFPKK